LPKSEKGQTQGTVNLHNSQSIVLHHMNNWSMDIEHEYVLWVEPTCGKNEHLYYNFLAMGTKLNKLRKGKFCIKNIIFIFLKN
jgi:hypothetical protein